MAQTVRQNRLFVAEDYTAIYESYVNANFQAYDYDTIRDAMVSYVRTTYPENFNDWIESSEFIALLDIVAQFGHNLAFRVDMNSRNNFLSTAERQDAVFKLSEFLGYQPRRNLAASGLMKITSIRTNENVIGSQGTSLGGQEIRYENSNSVDNLDDFITVLNAVMSPGTQFGSPRKQATIDGILTQFYNLNNERDQIQFIISGQAQGSSSTFDVVGLQYDAERKRIIETEPDPDSAFSIIYKNDGTGITSNNTGFFVGLRQGSMAYKDFNITDPIDNLSLDISANDVNETDVWVQRINSDGTVAETWSKVDNVFGSSVAYNALAQGERNIFSVKTRANNNISIQFPDRRFGNLPRGTIRVWYRTSINDTYNLRPEDVGTQRISISYKGIDGNSYNATIGLQLKQGITNASSSESLDDIKTNAPRIYATQDRMITAQDYSSYLVRQSDNILKIKSVNRTHSGHSRFIDYMDPTGAYTNLHLFGTDGRIVPVEEYQRLNVTYTDSESIYFDIFVKALSNPYSINNFYKVNRQLFQDLYDQYNNQTFQWQSVVSLGDTSTGYFVDEVNSIQNVGLVSVTYTKYIKIDSMIKFLTPDNEEIWAKVTSIKNNGLGVDYTSGTPSGKTATGIGAIALDRDVPQDSEVVMIYPAISRKFKPAEKLAIMNALDNSGHEPFSLQYDFETTTWKIVEESASEFNSNSFRTLHAEWTSSGETEGWDFFIRHYIYRFTSNRLSFTNISDGEALDEKTLKPASDKIRFVIYNENGNVTYKESYVAKIVDEHTLYLSIEDKNNDLRPDDPDVFYELFGDSSILENIRFEWEHVPANNELLDPSFTNIIDVYALTRNYDTNYRRYLMDDTGYVSEPVPPTIDELNQQFGQVHSKKAMADKIIYRPVKYKPLFGAKSDTMHQGTIRVIKMPGSNMTDNEIKSRVSDAVEEFFNLNNWDFGETFYFTELAAYVHKQLVGIISSLVIVPTHADSVFGELFQITANTDEIFIPDIGIDTIDIIKDINETTIKMA